MTTATRDRIIDVAASLLADGGPSAVTTRAVAAAAGVQPPTIYRQFGDKDGLLQAVADRVFAEHVAAKRVRDDVDPVEDMRSSFQAQVDFGLAHPGLTAVFSDPLRPRSATEDAGIAVLRERIHRVALAGRLRVTEDHAVALVHAIGLGVVLALVGTPEGERDPGLADSAWDAFAAVAVTTEQAASADGSAAATALRLRADDDALSTLRPAEQPLMREWLGRIAESSR